MPASLAQPVVNVAVVVLRRPGKMFRRFRRSVRAMATLLVLAPIVVIVLTQGPVPRYLLKRVVQGQLGGPAASQAPGQASTNTVEFESRWVSVKLDGRVVIEQPRLTNTAIAGAAGELFTAESVTLNAEWSAFTAGLSGIMSAADIRIERPVFRISVDRQDGTLNLAGVGVASRTTTPKATDTTLRVPRIEIERGRLVLMEHGPTPEDSAAQPAELVDLQTRGWLTSLPAPDQYLLRLRAEDPFGGNTPIDLTGTVDLARGQGVIDAGSLQLARWGPSRMPAIVRDTWERLRLRGTIQQTRLRFGPEIGVQTELRLQDVALNVPVAAGRAEITGSRTPRMDGVTGTLRLTTGGADGSNAGLEADLAGSFEDLPAHVRLVTRGLSLTSPYSATISAEQFRLERDPRILWFTPEIVQKNFERFSGPTALVDARIEVSRGRPESETVAGETIIRGSLMFREGAAAFDQFPYPIHNLAGTITFNEDEVRIIGLRGDGPTGGKFLAEGVIAPPTSDAMLNIDVVVTDVPLDDALADAIRRSKGRELADAIFSRPDYDRLLGAGMVLSTAAKRQYEQEIAQIEATLASSETPDAALISRRSDLQRRLAAPLADFGGLLDSIAVKVRSDFGFAAPTRQEIRVRFRDAMLLTKFFPLPMRAQRLELLVTDDAAIMEGVGLIPAGATAGATTDPGSMDLLARVDIRRDPASGQWTYDPNVAARVRQVRVTPLLIAAIPDKQAVIAGPVPPGERSPGVQALLSQLNIQGAADADVVLTTPPGGETSLSVDLRFEQVASTPRFTQPRRAEPGTLHDVAGRIRINDDAIIIESLRGLISHQQPKT
ncbi:MAG: hypothetical protein MUE97_04575, partial [Phycisphaerales bacterium]|nr:hypothetical protein [Phycisphaerales bacterium]